MPLSPPGVVFEGGPQERASKPLAETRQFGQGLHGASPGDRVALLEHRHDDLLEERRFTVGRRAVHPQMSGLDTEPTEARRQAGDPTIIEVTAPYRPPAALRALIGSIALSPVVIARPLLTAETSNAQRSTSNLEFERVPGGRVELPTKGL